MVLPNRNKSNLCLGATILRQLEVEHPAAKVLVELSQLQDREVGDGTTSVVIIAAELLKVTVKTRN
jgi:chaperonin GroEL (HSP60 family)